jgi:4'-phosphopantetheinyl transferase
VGLDAPAPQHHPAVLSREEQWRAKRFRTAQDRERYVRTHAALREILARYVDHPPASLTFARGAWGKPLLNAPNAPRFNLAHAGDLALVAVTQSNEVGVDVEPIISVADCLDIARAYFSNTERRELAALAPREREMAFLHCWTRKEALMKGTGRGFSLPPDSFDVPFVPPNNTRVYLHIDGRHEPWAIHTFVPEPGYVAAVALYGDVVSLQQMRIA